MKLKDMITNAFAYGVSWNGIAEINFDRYMEDSNLHITVYCKNFDNKFLKLWYGGQKRIAFELDENQWNALKELGGFLMYKALHFKFKDANFRSAFEAIVQPIFSESDMRVWIYYKERLYDIIKEYFQTQCSSSSSEQVLDMSSFVTAALVMDIHSIARNFSSVIERSEAVPVDVLDNVDISDLIQRACEDLCDITYF